jgi:hypothetical protein
MAGGPTPQTRFEAWPQALIGLTNTSSVTVISELKRGLLALIMIADTKEDWAAWYYFGSDHEIDIQLMGNFTTEILAEKPKFPSHFTTHSPMRVGELCGTSNVTLRRAALHLMKRDEDEDVVELLLFVQSALPGLERARPRIPFIFASTEKMARAMSATFRSASDGSSPWGLRKALIFCGPITAKLRNCAR